MRRGGRGARWIGALALALAPASCRFEKIPVDTSQVKFIPGDVALAHLREILPTAEVVFCSLPKARYEREEIAEWRIDAKEFEFRGAGKSSFRLAYAEIVSMRLERNALYCQVRLFTEAQKAPDMEHFHFGWRAEEPARRAFELLEALRQKQ